MGNLHCHFAFTDLLETYIAQGASAVVLSDAIFDKEAMNQSNFDAIQQLAHLSALHGGEAVERCGVMTHDLLIFFFSLFLVNQNFINFH